MPMVSLIGSCYDALESMKKELAEQKQKNGQPTKTTYSEVVYLLLKKAGRLEA